MLIGEHLICSLGVIPACVDRRTFHMLIGEHLIYIHSVSYRHVLIGEHLIYIHSVSYRRVLIGEHFTYVPSAFDMLVSTHLYTHSAFNMLASKRVFDIRYYNVDLQTCVLTQYLAVMTSLCSSVTISVQSHIPLSAYVGRRTFRIYPLGV